MVSPGSPLKTKLWEHFHGLTDQGMDFLQYATELAFLLYLKIVQETGEESVLPKSCRWADLLSLDGIKQFNAYRQQLIALGSQPNSRVRTIYENASTTLREPRSLSALVTTIDSIDWFSDDKKALGSFFEDLLAAAASDAKLKSDAGEHYTPRPLIESIVSIVHPRSGECIQDPAAGTGGFLIYADQYIKSQTDQLFDLPATEQSFQRGQAFVAMEYLPEIGRLCLINLMLHDMGSELLVADLLSSVGADLPHADVILTNPPFGTVQGGRKPTRDDLTYPTSKKQLAFLQHCYRGLKPGGRCVMLAPDNVLFEDGVGQQVREDLMNKCNLHTILRLPVGIFQSQGAKSNVLFFSRGHGERNQTSEVWIYDLRSEQPQFGKRAPLMREHFASFERAFGEDPLGTSPRTDEGANGRFRCFSREAIRVRNDNLDISWTLSSGANHGKTLPEPGICLGEIRAKLQSALAEVDELEALVGK